MESLKSFALKQTASVDTLNLNTSTGKDTLECVAHDCPQLLVAEFQDLFPNLTLGGRPLTVLNLAQKTENDMGVWSLQMEAERDQLTADFISSASAICDSLREAGYWADFIDPSSGRPYLGPFTNATLFETDGRLQNFGFSIEDLGCCKVINHRLWGRNAFIGTLFTTATLQSPVVQTVLESVKQSSTE